MCWYNSSPCNKIRFTWITPTCILQNDRETREIWNALYVCVRPLSASVNFNDRLGGFKTPSWIQKASVHFEDQNWIAISRMDLKISFFVGIFLMLLVSFAEGTKPCPPGNVDCRYNIKSLKLHWLFKIVSGELCLVIMPKPEHSM